MVHFSALLLSLAASASFVAAAPPNPDQLYVLQQSAESVASASPAPSTVHERSTGHHAHSAKEKKDKAHENVKRHLAGQQGLKAGGHNHQRRHAMGMQKRPASERRAPAPGSGGAMQLGGRKEDVREREKKRRAAVVVDSSATPDDKEGESDIAARDNEARAEQYYLASSAAPASASTAASSSASAAASSAKATTTAATSTTSSLTGAWTGVSSYYLYALNDADRIAVLDAIQGGGFKTVRIFIAAVAANNKGSGNAAVNDLEPNSVGTYDDTILTKIDQLMVECKARGLKLVIALSDRYALGFWSTDAYALKLNIVKAGSSGVQKVADASTYYTSASAIQMVDNRLQHIMTHKNAALGKTWAELDEVIYAVEAQNEPQGYVPTRDQNWVCDRSAYLKSLIPSSSSILVSSGGGITTTTSLQSWATGCDSLDIISVHDYGTSATSTAAALKAAQDSLPGKIVMMGEWGVSGYNKAALVSQFVAAFKAQSIPQMYWEVVKPGQAASDFEVWTDEPSWSALTGDKYYTASAVPASTTSAAVVKPTTTAASSTQWAAATSSLASKVTSAAEKVTSAAASAASAAKSKATSSPAVVASADSGSDNNDDVTTKSTRVSWKSASA